MWRSVISTAVTYTSFATSLHVVWVSCKALGPLGPKGHWRVIIRSSEHLCGLVYPVNWLYSRIWRDPHRISPIYLIYSDDRFWSTASMAEKNCQNRFRVSFHRNETAAGKSSISSVLISFSLLSLSFRSFLQRKMVKPMSNLCFSSPYLTVLNCAEDMFGASLLRFCRLVRLVRVVKVFRVKYMKDILLVDDYSNFNGILTMKMCFFCDKWWLIDD